MKDKLYREVSVTDRLPQTERRYLVKSHGEWFSASYLEQFSFHEEMLDCSGVTHWLEEISLPTNEEVARKCGDIAIESGSIDIGSHFMLGIIFLTDYLKGGKHE